MAYSKIETIRYLRESGYVERAHNLPHRGSYTVGKHCYDMLVLLFQLHPRPTGNLVKAIMFHDAAERTTGDIPAPAKWSYPEMTREYEAAATEVECFLGIDVALTDLEHKWLKALDAVEFYLWCLDEKNMGNNNADNCLSQIRAYLDTADLPNEVKEFYRDYSWRRTPEQLPVPAPKNS